MSHDTLSFAITRDTLPITPFRKTIIETVRNNPVTIITANTGGGKSTQVPQFLLEAGFNLVVTEPRRLAARSVAARVASEFGQKLGHTIGVRTRDDRIVSTATKCLFATDGLALVRELMGAGNHNLLGLDELHEWNLNLEVLIAWSKLQLNRGADFKLVLMSATLEAEKLSAYFNGAPIISVPGRCFPVEERQPGPSIVDDAATLLKAGRNVLIFQPGKSEITQTIADLEAMDDVIAEILPLHGELTPEDQQAVFQKYRRPVCIVATNVAQTSITIEGIDAVIDSGLERRTELVGGVEGLYLKPISRADGEQRKGRAGRTKAGIYIDHCPAINRPEFPMPEILRSRLDQTVLRLAEAGLDAAKLEFFHQPDKAEIHEAKRALKALGCMNEKGEVTQKGKRVSTMPISVELACMVIEAEKRHVVDDVLTIAAILEVGEITSNKDENGFRTASWRTLCPTEQESDVMAQLAIYKAASIMRKDEFRKNGIHRKAYFQAKGVRQHLAESLRGKISSFESSGRREDIIRSVCAGMIDHLYRYEGMNYRNGDGTYRTLNQDSVIPVAPEWLVGKPWDLQVKGKYGLRTLNLIRMATKVQPEWLVEIAPQLSVQKSGLNPRYDSVKDCIVSTTQIFFNGQLVKEEEVPDEAHPDAHEIFAAWAVRSTF